MAMPEIGKRYLFKARVEIQLSTRSFFLKDVFNVSLDTPYRYHLWADVETNNLFRNCSEVYFMATICMYQKFNGNWRFGLKEYELVADDDLGL